MSKVTVIDHPLVQHKLALLRDKETGTKAFRELVSELAMLMGYEVTRDLPLQEVEVETPITKASPSRCWPTKSWLWFPSFGRASAWRTA